MWNKYTSILITILLVLYVTRQGLSTSQDNDWQEVIKAPEDVCPDITGTYLIMDEAGYLMLGGHYEKNPKGWDTLNISGNPQHELQISLYETNTGAINETPIKRVRDKDYQCQNGFLETEWPSSDLPLNREDEGIPDDDLFEKSLSFAKNKMGELVIRTNTRHWKGFATLCFDGCKVVPIPFTSHTRYTWSRWPSASVPIASNSAENTNASSTEPAIADDGTPEASARRALRKITKPGAKLISLTNNGDKWKATFHGDPQSLLVLHETAQSSGDIQLNDVKIDSSSATPKELQIEFRLPSTKKELERKQIAENDRLYEATDRALVKRLLPSFPKGMTMTLSHHDAETYLVEVRHKNEDAFYELITRAVASGEFLKAEIKAHKYVDNAGKHVVDVLLIPKPQEQTSSSVPVQ